MFSIRDIEVRESGSLDSHHAGVRAGRVAKKAISASTITEDSSLFIAHQLQGQSTTPVYKPSRRWFRRR